MTRDSHVSAIFLPQNPALESDFESFSELNLDERIVQALAELGFTKPTNIQVK